jgi:ArsR family transcriptional regulator
MDGMTIADSRVPALAPGCADSCGCSCNDSGAATGMTIDGSEQTAAVFKALSDPIRLRLYSRIAARDDETCVCDISDVGVSQPTVSHHLRKLRDAGLIDCQRRGTWV